MAENEVGNNGIQVIQKEVIVRINIVHNEVNEKDLGEIIKVEKKVNRVIKVGIISED